MKQAPAPVQATLTQLGCTPREIQIYLCCLQHKPASVQEIARRLGFNRVTVYSAVEQLLLKGFLAETREGKRRLLVAEPPQKLLLLVQKKDNELQAIKANLATSVQILSEMHGTYAGAPTLRFYRGTEGLKQLLEETLEAKTDVLVMIDILEFRRILGEEYLLGYYKKRAEKNIRSRLIWPECNFAKEIQLRQKDLKTEVRTLSAKTRWKVGFFCWNDLVGIKTLTEGELTCTIIKSKEISEFYRRMYFETMWAQATC